MNDPWNPTSSEVREWAFDPNAPEPTQELVLSRTQHEPVYLDLASGESCPRRRYFPSLLYFMVGDAVRSDFHSRPHPTIKGFINRGDDFDHPDIRLWQKGSRDLLARPDSFEYNQWCGGFRQWVALPPA
jgi:hypothetical protein